MNNHFSQFEYSLLISVLEEKEQTIKNENHKIELKLQVLMEEQNKNEAILDEIIQLRNKLVF